MAQLSGIGIFGGTFSPPHLGHLIVAEYVRDRLDLDKIVFLPSAIPPHKQHLEIISSHHRVEMLRLALEGNDHFEISEIEIQRGGVSYTVDTLGYLSQRENFAKLVFLIGLDNLVEFHEWKSPERILELAQVVVMTRPGTDIEQVPIEMRRKVALVQVPEIDISSSEIRERVRTGKSIRYLVPQDVIDYIQNNNLFQSNK